MSTGSSEEDDLNASPLYKDREEWKDVQPIYNSPAEDAVVRIRHTPSFLDAFAYFRAILHSNELSERALELTTTCSQLNPANYSVWQYRRRILKALNADLADEFRFTEEMLNENPKNYQIWHHRRMLVESANDASRELALTEYILQSDAKNYHAWQYRQWVVEKYDLFSDKEVAYSTTLLAEDLRNNSAWNYRYFIVNNLTNTFKASSLLTNEIEFAKAAIQKLPNNESSWCYLSGLLINGGPRAHPAVLEFCKKLLEENVRSPHLRCFLLDHHMELLEEGKDASHNANCSREHLKALVDIDPIRLNYYEYLRTRVESLSANA